MNILLLTPDAVGGTFLERMISIYAQFQTHDKPVIDIHRIDNKLEKVYSPDFNMEILQNSSGTQPLEKTIELLKESTHYSIAKLVYYRMEGHPDSPNQKREFYQFLSENFFIISCRRRNIFENALSWSFNNITGALNVYHVKTKLEKFVNLFKNPVYIDPESFVQSLEKYRRYINWADQNFSIGSYWYYENHVHDVENYIRKLPMFSNSSFVGWKDKFGIDFECWNRCHFLKSDIGNLALKFSQEKFELLSNNIDNSQDLNPDQTRCSAQAFLSAYDTVADGSWPKIKNLIEFQSLPDNIKNECMVMHGLEPSYQESLVATKLEELNPEYQQYLKKYQDQYYHGASMIDQMRNLGILPNHVPIKKNTLAEKMIMCKNLDEIISTYNNWSLDNLDISDTISFEQLQHSAALEIKNWKEATKSTHQLIV